MFHATQLAASYHNLHTLGFSSLLTLGLALRFPSQLIHHHTAKLHLLQKTKLPTATQQQQSSFTSHARFCPFCFTAISASQCFFMQIWFQSHPKFGLASSHHSAAVLFIIFSKSRQHLFFASVCRALVCMYHAIPAAVTAPCRHPSSVSSLVCFPLPSSSSAVISRAAAAALFGFSAHPARLHATAEPLHRRHAAAAAAQFTITKLLPPPVRPVAASTRRLQLVSQSLSPVSVSIFSHGHSFAVTDAASLCRLQATSRSAVSLSHACINVSATRPALLHAVVSARLSVSRPTAARRRVSSSVPPSRAGSCNSHRATQPSFDCSAAVVNF